MAVSAWPVNLNTHYHKTLRNVIPSINGFDTPVLPILAVTSMNETNSEIVLWLTFTALIGIKTITVTNTSLTSMLWGVSATNIPESSSNEFSFIYFTLWLFIPLFKIYQISKSSLYYANENSFKYMLTSSKSINWFLKLYKSFVS